MLYGDKAETDFPPEESEHVVLPEEVMRQINALKAGRGIATLDCLTRKFICLAPPTRLVFARWHEIAKRLLDAWTSVIWFLGQLL